MRGSILVVHRNQLILEAIREMLQDIGYSVTLANDGYRALGKALSVRFDLIIVNHALDGSLTGNHLAERLKKYWVDAPIIGSAPNAAADQGVGFAEGTIDYLLPAPFDYAQLIHAVETLTNPQPKESIVDAGCQSSHDMLSECEWFAKPGCQGKKGLIDHFSVVNAPPASSKEPVTDREVSESVPTRVSQEVGSQQKTPCILLAETDRLQCDHLKMYLQDAGYAVSVFHNGCQAYEDTMLNDYDLILTDIWLPGMDGFEMIDAMRKSGVDGPIAVLTAYITREIEQELVAYRISKIMRKPVKLAELLSLVKVMPA